ncbi:MAG: hypothetical protein Q8O87_03555 [bacterium]|nr:hypothetical protein [bacterium]
MMLPLLYFLIFPLPAHAYLDPGTGSFLIQLIVSGVIGGAYVVKTFWKNIRGFVSSRSKSETLNEEAQDDNQGVV